jgi:hypothetical protein
VIFRRRLDVGTSLDRRSLRLVQIAQSTLIVSSLGGFYVERGDFAVLLIIRYILVHLIA